MQLLENDDELRTVCRSVEKLTNQIRNLSNFKINVELLDSFENIHTSPQLKATIKSPAAYCHSKKKILVNSKYFFSLDTSIQEIILIHELGHAYLHLSNQSFDDTQFKKNLSEEHVVDYIVCIWGFEKPLIADRSASYGNEYCDALKLWRDKERFIEAMEKAYIKQLIGDN